MQYNNQPQGTYNNHHGYVTTSIMGIHSRYIDTQSTKMEHELSFVGRANQGEYAKGRNFVSRKECVSTMLGHGWEVEFYDTSTLQS